MRDRIIEVMARAMTRFARRDALEAAEQALSALEASGMAVVPGWQPIESAPKDGRDVVLYKPNAKRPIKVDRWMQRETGGNWWECRPAEMPTHWMPLPAPPTNSQRGKR